MRKTPVDWRILLALAAGYLGSAGALGAEVPGPRVYDRLDAAFDSYTRAEADRRDALGLQLEANDAMAWRAGAPTYSQYPPDLDSVYAFPPRAYRYGSWRSPATIYRGYPGVFEPWPFVPGDIYGYPYVDRIEQPQGHVVIPYGPNGYYYGPVYGSDLIPDPEPEAPPPAALPTPATPREIEPPSPQPGPEPVPAPPPAQLGPQEF